MIRWYCQYAFSYGDLKEIDAVYPLSVQPFVVGFMNMRQKLINEQNLILKRHAILGKLMRLTSKLKAIRAIDKNGQTLDWMLSRHRNKKATKRFFKKILENSHINFPKVINVDKNPALPPAHNELQTENDLPKTTKLRCVKYLNNSIENDHKFTKLKSRYRQWYQSFETTKRTIDGMETMRMIQKCQFKYLAKGNVRAQNDFLLKLFNLAA